MVLQRVERRLASTIATGLALFQDIQGMGNILMQSNFSLFSGEWVDLFV